MLRLGADIFSEAWAGKWKTAKKKDIFAELDRAFADPSKFSGNKETEHKLRTWLPKGMAFTEVVKTLGKINRKAA